ncbi:hypothetical protein U1Q18_052199, partial [Sarracenia purpurea var. burkii]
DENYLFLENNQVQSLDDESEGMDSAFSNENSMSLLNNAMLPSAPPLPEYINSPSFSDEVVDNKRTTKTDNEHVEISCLWSGKLATESIGVFFKTEHQQFEKDNQSPQPFNPLDIAIQPPHASNKMATHMDEVRAMGSNPIQSN